jgi:streptogramin lyase
VSDVRVGLDPGPIAVTPTAIWTANDGDGTVSRYDLRTHTVQTRGGFPDNPGDVNLNIVADPGGNVWVSGETPVVTRLAGATAAGLLHPSERRTVTVPGPAVGYEAVGAGYLWTIVGPYTSSGKDDRLSLIDLAGGQILDSVRLGHATTAIAYGYGAAWVGAWINEPQEMAILTGPSWLYVFRAGGSPAQHDLDRHPLRGLLETGDSSGPLSIAVGAGAVWLVTCGICNEGGEVQALLKVDPLTLRVVKRIPLDRGTIAPLNEVPIVAAGVGSVWVTSPDGSGVSQLDPKTGRILRAIHLGRTDTCGIAVTTEAVWVTIGNANHC